MSYVIENGAMYFYGSEYYEYGKLGWVFITNYPNEYSRHVSACINYTKLPCAIMKIAFDTSENLLPNNFSLWIPAPLEDDPEFNRKLDEFFDVGRQLSSEYKRKLIEHDVVSEDFFTWDKPCFFGCEEAYGFTLPDGFNKREKFL